MKGMSRSKSFQLGWKKFVLVVDGESSAPLVTLEECDGYLRRSVTLRGFEVEWIGKKLCEASFTNGGDLFLGSLRSKTRWVGIFRIMNNRGRFIKIEVRRSRFRSVVCIPEDGQGKGWRQLQDIMVEMVQKVDNNGSKNYVKEDSKEDYGQNRDLEVPWLTFREAIDKFQESLGQCCGGSEGKFLTSVKIGFGRWSFVVPIPANSPILPPFASGRDGRTSMEIPTKQTVARALQTDMERGNGFRKFRGAQATVKSSTNTGLNSNFEKSMWGTAHSRSKIWVPKLTPNLNQGVCNNEINLSESSIRGSGSVKNDTKANKYGTRDIISANRMGVKSDGSGLPFGSHSSSSKSRLSCDPLTQAEENVNDLVDSHSQEHSNSVVDCKPSSSSEVISSPSIKSGVASLHNNRWWPLVGLEQNGEAVVECDGAGDGLKLREDVEGVSIPSSPLDVSAADESSLNGGEIVFQNKSEAQLKRLRAKKILKGRFWFLNRLDFFKVQRRCGSLRVKNLIFGV